METGLPVVSRMTEFEQLQMWHAGDSRHHKALGCVPDFSCCRPELQASVAERDRFMSGYISGQGKADSADTLVGLVAVALMRLKFAERLLYLCGGHLKRGP